MKAGHFDRIVTLLSPAAETDDGYTTAPGGWTTAGTRKARYLPARPREIFENAGKEAELPVVWEMRHDSLTRMIEPTWKLTFEGKTFDIHGVEEIGRREGIQLITVASDESIEVVSSDAGELWFDDETNSGLLALIIEDA